MRGVLQFEAPPLSNNSKIKTPIIVAYRSEKRKLKIAYVAPILFNNLSVSTVWLINHTRHRPKP